MKAEIPLMVFNINNRIKNKMIIKLKIKIHKPKTNNNYKLHKNKYLIYKIK